MNNVGLNNNPFGTYAYASYANVGGISTADLADMNASRETFSGADLQVYFNNKHIRTLESISWTTSVEVVGNYGMGSRNVINYVTGKRVIVGSFVMQQFANDPLLEDVFAISSPNRYINTVSDIWNAVAAATNFNNQGITTPTNTGNNGTVNAFNTNFIQPNSGINQATVSAYGMRGITSQQFQAQVSNQIKNAVAITGAEIVAYADQMPEFNITLIGVNQNQAVSQCTLFGVKATQDTGGFSGTDLQNSRGYSFVAKAIDPWHSVDLNAASVVAPTGSNFALA